MSKENNYYWMFARCFYGYCQTMWQQEGNICFQEVDVVKRKYLEAVEVENMEEPPKCIVEHPGFQAVCLNYWVLRAAWQYKQQYGVSAYEESDHKKCRHIAYRQLVRWYWGSLGRDIGVTLPSLIPVQLSVYDLISRSPKGWRMRWSSQDSIVQMNKYIIYCK